VQSRVYTCTVGCHHGKLNPLPATYQFSSSIKNGTMTKEPLVSPYPTMSPKREQYSNMRHPRDHNTRLTPTLPLSMAKSSNMLTNRLHLPINSEGTTFLPSLLWPVQLLWKIHRQHYATTCQLHCLCSLKPAPGRTSSSESSSSSTTQPHTQTQRSNTQHLKRTSGYTLTPHISMKQKPVQEMQATSTYPTSPNYQSSLTTHLRHSTHLSL